MINSKIACIGESMWDVYSNAKFIGGVPANVAVHLAQAGQQAYLFTRVGQDALGRELVQTLAQRQVITDFIQTDNEYATGILHISVDNQGQPSYHCTHDVAFDHFENHVHWLQQAAHMDAIFFTILSQRAPASRTVIEQVLQHSPALKICDVNIRRWNVSIAKRIEFSFHQADILKFNELELGIVQNGFGFDRKPHEFLSSLLKTFNLKAVVVTCAEQGSYAVTPDEIFKHAGYPVQVKDASGSGDAFSAALTIKYLQGANWSAILDFANRVGGFVAEQQGAVPFWSVKDFE